jgi:hypothetical protein
MIVPSAIGSQADNMLGSRDTSECLCTNGGAGRAWEA